MVQITKDEAYDAVAPDDFPAMLNPARYGVRSTAFDKIISATHDHFWDPLDKKYIDFDAAVRHGQRGRSCRKNCFPIFHDPHRRQADVRAEDQVRQSIRALAAFLHPAWRAGRAGPLRLALPCAQRPGRAGIRRQPDARGSPPRHRVRQLHQGALGHAAAVRRRRFRHC